MALSIKESGDLNLVLRYLLAIDRPVTGPVPAEEAKNAALRLTGAAHRVLGAGLMPHQVAEAWPVPNRKKKGSPK